jgi:hypothetical protein
MREIRVSFSRTELFVLASLGAAVADAIAQDHEMASEDRRAAREARWGLMTAVGKLV